MLRILKNLLSNVLLAVICVFVVACANEEELASPDDKPITLTLGFQANDQSNEYAAAQVLAKRANELSGGTLTIKIVPSGKLGNDVAMIEQVMAGSPDIDMTYAETGRFGIWIPEMEIFGYPFAFDSFEHLLRTMETPYGYKLKDALLKKGIRILVDGYNGTRHTTARVMIKSIKDMKGLKLRVPNAVANKNFAKYSGAIVTPLPFSEVYDALKTNKVDAQENPLSTIKAKNFDMVQKYCALTGHIINDNNFIISEKSWEKLSEHQQKALIQATKEAAGYQTKKFKQDEHQLIKEFRNNGMIVTFPNREEFRKAMAPMFKEYEKKYGDSAIKAIESTR